MTRKRTLRIVLAALSLALLAAGAAQGGGVRTHYIFRGHLLATPPANATSISLTVEGGNRIALKKMLGSSVDQTSRSAPAPSSSGGRTACRRSSTRTT